MRSIRHTVLESNPVEVVAPPGPSISLQQTGVRADHTDNVACSGLTPGADSENIKLEEGGTPGAVGWGINVTTEAIRAHLYMESAPNEPNQVLWDAGTWTVRVNVRNDNPQVSIRSCYICRVDKVGVNKGAIGMVFLSIPCTRGVKTWTIAGMESDGLVTDRVQIVIGMKWQGIGAQNITIRPNQIVDTPILTRAA